LRIQAAVRGLSHGLVAAATVMLLALVLFRLDVLSRKWLLSIAWLSPIGVLLTMLGLALRRIDPLWVAAQIDKSHQLNDRLSSALQFASVAARWPRRRLPQVWPSWRYKMRPEWPVT
jgi:hypothetical protein